jgi:hypothetical protein
VGASTELGVDGGGLGDDLIDHGRGLRDEGSDALRGESAKRSFGNGLGNGGGSEGSHRDLMDRALQTSWRQRF